MLAALALPLVSEGVRHSITDFLKAMVPAAPSSSHSLSGTAQQPQPLPRLELAKQIIPTNLIHIYNALNQGDLQGVQPYVSQQLAGNYQTLDQICKPFKYRAHYIEAIIERPQGRFEVRVHVLFQPMDERAYVLRFFMTQGGDFYLNDVLVPNDDWFGPGKEVAAELARNFVYAAKAHRTEELARLVTPGIPIDAYATDPCWKQFFVDSEEVRVMPVNLTSYKGPNWRLTLT